MTLVEGLPATTVERTIADLVRDGHDLSHIANVLRDAVRAGHTTAPRTHETDPPRRAVSDLARRIHKQTGRPTQALVRNFVEVGSELQPNVRTLRVSVEVYAGTKRAEQSHIDLVTGSMMTSDPETSVRRPDVVVPDVSPSVVLLYPVVDHVADKVCATETTYYRQRRVERHRRSLAAAGPVRQTIGYTSPAVDGAYAPT
ncbi:hypothetical protein [Isoptericola sp. BMS4]|uniref:hypothetical protein n=1 Tax=Isoptericola sp. BMS4 TaxID=2527875 RepID=UPI001421EC9B|nr:hypothetical protein [Isoptericola sp. BMS4]